MAGMCFKITIPMLSFLAFFFFSIKQPRAEGACPPDWSTFGVQCYKVFKENATQPESVDKCHMMEAELVSTHSNEENKFVEGLVNAISPQGEKPHYYWIGLTITRHSMNDKVISCHWIDGSPMNFGDVKMLNAGTYPWSDHSPQFPPEPNNFEGNESCVTFNFWEEGEPLGWVDRQCDLKIDGYICKKSA